MARYLKSQTTGVVLPYNEKLLKRPNVELMTPEECTAYEAGERARVAGTTVAEPVVVAEPEVVAEPVVVAEPEVVAEAVVVAEPEVAVLDIGDEEVDADALLASLEID